MTLPKVTTEGTEYNVVPSPDGTCFVYNKQHQVITSCAFITQSSLRCTDMPCRNPNVIFLTDANFAKVVTARLTE